MGGVFKVLLTAKTPEEIEPRSKMTKLTIQAKLGVSVAELDAKDIAQLKQWIEKFKKPADFGLTFDAGGFDYSVRVGTSKIQMSSYNLTALDYEKRQKALGGLFAYGVVNQAQVDAFNKANPDKAALAELKKQMDEAKKKLDAAQKEFDGLKKQYTDMGGK